jgi:hypothetical protein
MSTRGFSSTFPQLIPVSEQNRVLTEMMPRLTFLVGASGVGTSTLAREVCRYSKSICCLHFDDILAELGFWEPGEADAWQQRATFEWCRRVAQLPASQVLLEGQTRYAFAADACAAASIDPWNMVLVHCADEIRDRRLKERGAPELSNSQMTQWADWLLADSKARNVPILDTTGQSLRASCDQLAALLGLIT